MREFLKWYGLAVEMGYRRHDAFREVWAILYGKSNKS